MNADMSEPSPKRETSDDRRAAIALATRDLIVEKGFEGLRTRDIAERVGINIATLHYHVPSKAALIELVTQSMREEFIAQYLSHACSAKTPLLRLRQELADFADTLIGNPKLFLVMSELVEKARRDPGLMAAISPMQNKWRQMLTDILHDGRADGTFRADLDPEAAALTIMGALSMHARLEGGDPISFARLAVELERAFIHPHHCNETDL